MLGEFLNAVSAVVVLLMLMAVGYFMGTKGWMKAEEKNMIDIVKFGAVGDGAGGLGHLAGGGHGAEREPDDRAHRHAAAQIFHGTFHPARVDADGCGAVFQRLIADTADVLPACVRFQQRVVYLCQYLLFCHTAPLFPGAQPVCVYLFRPHRALFFIVPVFPAARKKTKGGTAAAAPPFCA